MQSLLLAQLYAHFFFIESAPECLN